MDIPNEPPLSILFPNIGDFIETSECTVEYNCIAWAANDKTRWWWPSGYYYWPRAAARKPTLQGAMEAFATLGYAPCENGSHEAGVEKIAIYLKYRFGPLTHAARQLEDGKWTSKIGTRVDISHGPPEVLACDDFGRVEQFMARQRQ
jgi:hypothetical protein